MQRRGDERNPGWRRAAVPAAFFVFWAACLAEAQVPAEPLRAGSIRVCSYNLKNWLSMERGFGPNIVPTSKPEKEKEKVVSFIVDIAPQVLGVCEIGSEDDLKELKGRLEKAGLSYPHVVYAHGGDPVRRLGLLSQFPVVAQNSQADLSYQLGELTFAFKRGILDATLQVSPDFSLHMVGVHLKSKREVSEADQALMRRNEAHLLREHLDRILTDAPDGKVLLYGDFNEEPREAPIEEIIGNRATPGLLMHEVALRDANNEMWTHFWDLHDLYSRLDYFFLSPALRLHVNDHEAFIYSAKDFDKGSDHRPIVVTVDLAAKKRSRSRK